MSRRKKTTVEHLILKGVSTIEWRLKNYLHKNDIYRNNNDMQTIIINSFFNENGGSNEAQWAEKLKYADDNFGKFAMYAQNNWKQL